MKHLPFLLLSLWRIVLGWLGRPYATEFAGEVPDRFLPRTIYLVGEGDYLWHASMVCPCGCGQVLHMNLQSDSRPLWRVTRHPGGTVSLNPSIWRQTGCRSHFWFRHGAVHWA